MKRIIAEILLMFSGIAFLQAQNTIQFSNINFFQNEKFQLFPTVYVENGLFTFNKPKKIDTIIDLRGKYIIPPFAEGHTHKLDMPQDVDSESQSFLSQGVFYALVLNNFSSHVDTNRLRFNRREMPDVLYANGGITVSGQHPSFAYERILSGIKDWWTPENTKKIQTARKGENDAYWFMNNPGEVDMKWNAYIKTKPDLVKVYLLNSRLGDSTNNSLSEASLQRIMQKAQENNLRVVAHIETANDLKMALHDGIKLFSHMPYYNVNYLKEIPAPLDFSKQELAMIKKLEPVIIPTLSFNEEFSIVRTEKNNYLGEMDTASFQRALKFQKNFLEQLSDAGFRFAIGSDRDSLISELRYWLRYQMFAPERIMTIATKDTPMLLFPKRKISELKEGYEASFLVLEKNPLNHFEFLQAIVFRIKQGKILQ